MKDNQKEIVAYTKKILNKIEEVLPRKPNEATFRSTIDPILVEFCKEIGVGVPEKMEYWIASSGRADAVFNRFVIEYETPGVIKESGDRGTLHAIQQVKDYILGISRKERHDMQRLAGVAFDGKMIVFIRFNDGSFIIEDPVYVNVYSMVKFLTWLSGLSSGVALIPENLNRDFSLDQTTTQDILMSFFSVLQENLKKDSLVSKLFEQWKIFFSESIDYSEAFGDRKLEELQQWVQKAGLNVESAEEAQVFFFALHTYFALIAKFLAWLALSKHMGGKLGVPSFGELSSSDTETLLSKLIKMESGGIFRDYGIQNLLEGDFFSWYTHAWNEIIDSAIRKILSKLDEYDPSTLTLIPEETRDLFKKLYHYLIPKTIRHNLGEYYTPDWLAQYVLNQIDGEFFASKQIGNDQLVLKEKLFKKRFLDPSCGSGTFPVLIISRIQSLGKMLNVQEEDLLETILLNVVGFDINPLAVLTARVNYLLAIQNLLQYRRREISIPIYLADSVRTPAEGYDKLFKLDAYEFPTAVGNFLVPSYLCVEGKFGEFCEILDESVHSEISADSFIKRVQSKLGKSEDDNGKSEGYLRKLYCLLFDLHKKGLDGLWARLLKNNFAPLTIGKFDYIVGNPPWVNWEHLPDEYREKIAPIWQQFGLFPQKGMNAAFTKDDLSVLLTYVVIEDLLDDKGKLGFVITQSVFKAGLGGQGFRQFKIAKSNTRIKVTSVDDMVAIKPFEGASNRTAVMFIEKGGETIYPVPYTIWKKPKGINFTYDSTLENVQKTTKRLKFIARPINNDIYTSTWLTVKPKAIMAIDKISGKSSYIAHEGVNTGGANGVYWVDITLDRPDDLVVVKNYNKHMKIKVKEAIMPIERGLLYPLLRSGDLKKWKINPSLKIILTHKEGMKLNAIPSNEMQLVYPKTYAYLKLFEPVLTKRSGWEVKNAMASGKPFYSLSEIGDYTFAPWKVVWTRLSKIEASVLLKEDDKVIIPQETITMVACESKEEAYYIAAMVNSTIFQFVAKSYSQEGGKSMGSIHVLHNIRIPKYNPAFKAISILSKKAHEAAKIDDQKKLAEIEAEIDKEAAKVWGLSDTELVDILESFAELQDTKVATGDDYEQL